MISSPQRIVKALAEENNKNVLTYTLWEHCFEKVNWITFKYKLDIYNAYNSINTEPHHGLMQYIA